MRSARPHHRGPSRDRNCAVTASTRYWRPPPLGPIAGRSAASAGAAGGHVRPPSACRHCCCCAAPLVQRPFEAYDVARHLVGAAFADVDPFRHRRHHYPLMHSLPRGHSILRLHRWHWSPLLRSSIRHEPVAHWSADDGRPLGMEVPLDVSFLEHSESVEFCKTIVTSSAQSELFRIIEFIVTLLLTRSLCIQKSSQMTVKSRLLH